jgi:hypothetical protein
MEQEDMIHKKRRRLAPLALVLAIALGLGGLLAGTASAATDAGPLRLGAADLPATAHLTTTAVRTTTVTFHRVSGGAKAGPDAAASTISCRISASAPLYVPPTIDFGAAQVDGAATTACTAAMPQISMAVAVYYDGGLAQVVYPLTNGSPSAYGAAYTYCTDGEYQTTAVADITAPAGYSPAVLELGASSALVTISC